MHELGITQEILAIVTEQSRGAKSARGAGDRQAVAPCCRTRCGFVSTCAASGTPAEGAELEIIETPGRARCRACGGEMLLEKPFGRCDCGGSDLDWLAGEELKIKAMEVDLRCAPPAAAPERPAATLTDVQTGTPSRSTATTTPTIIIITTTTVIIMTIITITTNMERRVAGEGNSRQE